MVCGLIRSMFCFVCRRWVVMRLMGLLLIIRVGFGWLVMCLSRCSVMMIGLSIVVVV